MGKYAGPPGMITKGWTVRLEPTAQQAAQFRRDCGARRFAYNWAVAEIQQAFGQGRETGEHDDTVWSAWSLRKRWNRVKGAAAPWWAECSKEAYAGGIADAVTALKNWHGSTTGEREGPPVRFPKFRKKTKDRPRCSYTTGALRVEGPRHVVLPGVGRVEASENMRAIWRHVRRGTGRVLAATISEKAGHWCVSLRLEITAPWRPPTRDDVVGVDVGIGKNLLIVMRPDGSVASKVANPRALNASLAGLRKASRSLSRKQEGSRRWHQARRTVARTQARIANIRKDAIHQATTELAKTHGQVVIENLAVAPLARGLRGGAVPNPLHAMAGLLAGLHDSDGRVTLPGFYDKVLGVSAAEREMFARLPFDEQAWLDEAGHSRAAAGEAGFSTLERIWARPAAEVNGMWGGHTGPGDELAAAAGVLAAAR